MMGLKMGLFSLIMVCLPPQSKFCRAFLAKNHAATAFHTSSKSAQGKKQTHSGTFSSLLFGKASSTNDYTDLPRFTLEDFGINKVTMIQNAEDLNHVKSKLTKADLVGLDTETKPRFSFDEPIYPPCLLQIAIRNRLPPIPKEPLPPSAVAGNKRLFDQAITNSAQNVDGSTGADACSNDNNGTGMPGDLQIEAAAQEVEVLLLDLISLLPRKPKSLREKSEGHLTSALAPVFLDPDIPKIGRDFRDDLRALFLGYPTCAAFHQVNGYLEICHLNRLADAHAPKVVGLGALSAAVLGARLDKGRVARSDWAARPLSARQVAYAAADAAVLVRLFEALEGRVRREVAAAAAAQAAKEAAAGRRLRRRGLLGRVRHPERPARALLAAVAANRCPHCRAGLGGGAGLGRHLAACPARRAREARRAAARRAKEERRGGGEGAPSSLGGGDGG